MNDDDIPMPTPGYKIACNRFDNKSCDPKWIKRHSDEAYGFGDTEKFSDKIAEILSHAASGEPFETLDAVDELLEIVRDYYAEQRADKFDAHFALEEHQRIWDAKIENMESAKNGV